MNHPSSCQRLNGLMLSFDGRAELLSVRTSLLSIEIKKKCHLEGGEKWWPEEAWEVTTPCLTEAQ